jgi:ABC-type transport system involved in multi-copper enzyme maturation permease subunit
MKLLKFELKKNFRKKKFIILFLIVSLFVVGLFIRNALMQEKIAENATLSLNPHYQETSDLVGLFLEKLKDDPKNDKLRASYDNAVKMNDDIKDLQNAFKSRDWSLIPQIEGDFLKRVTTHLKLGNDYKSLQGNKLEQRMQKNAILLKEHLPYEDENYSLDMPIFMKKTSTLLISLIGILTIVFIMGDQLSEEFESQTIKTLYTQPLRKWRILLSKYASLMTVSIFILFILFVLSAALSFLFGGKAWSFSYPQLVQFSNGFTYITTSEYLIKLAIIYVGAISFSFSLVLLVSVIFKNRFATILVSILILLSGITLTNQVKSWQTIQNPFYFFHFTELIERTKYFEGIGSIWILFTYSFIMILLCLLVQGKGPFFRIGTLSKRPFNKGRTLPSSKGILPIVLFEWRKVLRQGSFKQTSLVTLLLFLIGYVFLTYQTNQKHHDFVESMKNTLKDQKFEVQYLKQSKQKHQDKIDKLENKKLPLKEYEKAMLEGMKKSIPQIQAGIKESQMKVENEKDVLDAYKKKDWKRFYEYWIYQNQLVNGEIKSTQHYVSQFSNFTYKASIAEKKLLEKQNLEPVLPPEYLYTIYDDQYFPNQIERMAQKRSSMKIDNTGLFNVYLFFNSYIYLLALFILIFLFGSGFTTEKGKKRTLYLLQTQPLSRFKIFLGKYGVSVALSLGMALGIVLLLVVMGLVGNRFGDWNFPVLHYDTDKIAKLAKYTGISAQEGSFHFIEMGQYLLETIVLFLGAILFLISIALFFSLFVNSVITALISTCIITLSGYFVSSSSFISPISFLSPFTYLNVGKIANGELATLFHNSLIQTWTGLIVLLVSSIILFGAGLLWFQKRTRGHDLSKNKASILSVVEKS